MVRIVVDSSALILLAKCNLLGILSDIFELIVPPSVTAEVASEDLTGKYPDAALISELIQKGRIRVQDAEARGPELPISIHKGGKDSLFLAASLRNSVLATDDGKAIRAARFLKVPFNISPKIVIELFRMEKISFHEAREAIERLGKIGRYSPEITAEALISLMEERHAETHNDKDT